MPQSQRQRQQLIALTHKKGKRNNTKGVILIQKKTGYQNVTINGQHFYYNSRASLPMNGQFNINNAIRNSNGTSTSKPRQTILITRKR